MPFSSGTSSRSDCDGTRIPTGATVLIYNPYLSTLGGGERYALAVAAHLQERCQVTIASEALPAPDKMKALGFDTPCPEVEIPRSGFSDRARGTTP